MISIINIVTWTRSKSKLVWGCGRIDATNAAEHFEYGRFTSIHFISVYDSWNVINILRYFASNAAAGEASTTKAYLYSHNAREIACANVVTCLWMKVIKYFKKYVLVMIYWKNAKSYLFWRKYSKYLYFRSLRRRSKCTKLLLTILLYTYKKCYLKDSLLSDGTAYST